MLEEGCSQCGCPLDRIQNDLEDTPQALSVRDALSLTVSGLIRGLGSQPEEKGEEEVGSGAVGQSAAQGLDSEDPQTLLTGGVFSSSVAL